MVRCDGGIKQIVCLKWLELTGEMKRLSLSWEPSLQCCPGTTPAWSSHNWNVAALLQRAGVNKLRRPRQNTQHDNILYLQDGDPSVSTFAMASLSVSSLRLGLLLLLQLCLFFFLTASQIQEYHFCFFSFLTITEFLFLSNLRRRLEDLNLDLLWVCLSTLSGRPIFLHHFSIFPPIFSCYITSTRAVRLQQSNKSVIQT